MIRKPFLLIALLTAVLAGGLTLAPQTALAGPGSWFCKSGPGTGCSDRDHLTLKKTLLMLSQESKIVDG